MLVRVRDFGAAHADRFPPSTLGAKSFAAVASAVDALSEHAAIQLSGRGVAREGTTSKAVAREALREDLEAIIRTARALAIDMPGLDDKFRAPRGSGDRALLNAARAFAKDAAPLAKDFVAHDMPEKFLEELQESIKDFEDAIREREAGKGTHISARASIDSAMEEGVDAVRRLDAIVPNRLRDDTSTVAAWEHARRVEYPAAGRGKADTATAPHTPPPATASAPATAAN